MRNKILLLIFVFSLFFISSCNVKETPKENVECNSDTDCFTTGCSNQICTKKGNDIITTCEFKQEYQCLKLTSCLCINDKCQFEENKDYLSCLDKTK